MQGGEVIFKFKGDDKDLDKKTNNIASKLGNIGKSIGSAFVKGATVGATALTGLVTASVKMYADVEQSVGGVETLFKDSADTVIKNAKNAYKTAGMSANEYMENVTSFSASLLQSLSGDTKKASEYADRAMVDMSDNANKMGTSMEMIQNAYQGFAKQNYTMLDNLKLGYGGTQEEMKRLIKDASKMKDVQKELNVTVKEGDMSFGNIVNAISVMQQKMGIAGTTAKEASETITGSLGSAKAAFSNFLAGTGDIDAVVETFVTAGTNIGKAVGKMAPKVIEGITNLVSALIPKIPEAVNSLLPTLVTGVTSLLTSLVSIFPQLIQTLMGILPTLITSITNMMPTILEALIQSTIAIITSLAEVLPELIPTIIDAILAMIPVLIENIPLFIDAGIELLLGLLDGIINAIPTLVDYIPEIVEAIVEALVGGIPRIVAVAPVLIMDLARAIVKAIPSLVYAVPKIIGAIVNGLIDGLVSIKDVGINMVKGLWQGMQETFNWLVNKIKGFADSILGGIKGIFGIHSPSTEFAFVGKMNMLGLEKGMEDMQPQIQKSIDGMFDLSPNLYGNTSTNLSPQVNVVNNINMTQDPLGQMVNEIKTFGGGAKNDYNYGMA